MCAIFLGVVKFRYIRENNFRAFSTRENIFTTKKTNYSNSNIKDEWNTCQAMDYLCFLERCSLLCWTLSIRPSFLLRFASGLQTCSILVTSLLAAAMNTIDCPKAERRIGELGGTHFPRKARPRGGPILRVPITLAELISLPILATRAAYEPFLNVQQASRCKRTFHESK